MYRPLIQESKFISAEKVQGYKKSIVTWFDAMVSGYRKIHGTCAHNHDWAGSSLSHYRDKIEWDILKLDYILRKHL